MSAKLKMNSQADITEAASTEAKEQCQAEQQSGPKLDSEAQVLQQQQAAQAAMSRAETAEAALQEASNQLRLYQKKNGELVEELEAQQQQQARQEIELTAAKKLAKGFEACWTACKAELQSAEELSSKLAAELAAAHHHNQARNCSIAACTQTEAQSADKLCLPGVIHPSPTKSPFDSPPSSPRSSSTECTLSTQNAAKALAAAQECIAQLEADLASAQHAQNAAEAKAQQLTLDLTHSAKDLTVLQHNQKRQSVDHVMRDFLLGVKVPERPTVYEMSLIATDSVSVKQLASHQYHHRLLAVMLKLGVAWTGAWQLVPLPQVPNMSLYQLQYSQFGLMGKGSFGSVFYGQIWVGDDDGVRVGSSWTPGWQAVAIKKVEVGHFAFRELTALNKVAQHVQQLEQTAERLGQQPDDVHIIRLLGQYTTSLDGQDYQMLVTRFTEGHELHMVLDDLWAIAGAQQEAAAQEAAIDFWLWVLKKCFHQLLKGLVCLHNCGLVHGDIKADNAKAAVDEEAQHVHLELLDLSAACPNGTKNRDYVGCLSYSSPETMGTLSKPGVFTYASDVWSAGCLLFELITERPPFDTWHDRNTRSPEQQMHQLQKRHMKMKSGWAKGLVQHEGKTGMALLEERLSGQASELPGVKGLLSSMLQYNPVDRSTAMELLNHPWLQS